MNISTGGLHILLFERDQQLAALLMSELQLAGYEGHTARTAVEVFDAIARYPVRLVLVNLAQAAAARREFWVALDTQRRGGSIQVLTFHCVNLAGYGSSDFEERLATVADIEIDGMMGLMKLIDVVRTRFPNNDINANTVPRMNRTLPAPPVTATRFNESVSVPNTMSNNSVGRSSVYSRNTLSDEGNKQVSAAHVSAVTMPHTPPSVTPVAAAGSSPPFQVHHTSQMPPVSSASRNSQTVEKIRAVIYPSQQRNWNAPVAPNWETSQPQDSPAYASSPSQAPAHSASDTPVLQGLANGQVSEGASGESGLAQLTRMVQESQVPNRVSPVQTGLPEDTSGLPTYTPATAHIDGVSETIRSQSLRPAPIEDLPEERPVATGPLGTDVQRRSEILSRPNSNQPSSVQIPSSAAQSPLASIATSGMATNSVSTSIKGETGEDADWSKDAQRGSGDLATLLQAHLESRRTERETEAQPPQEYTSNSSSERNWERHEKRQQEEEEEEILAKNSVILDILQSLPLMPAVGQQQAVQPQVLNGRVTRSLGSVLLDGHLVPQERLEVAQNIQRMLRGVDLNYHLGEILLMFKLLTPDQLLAASLVSYGLITTTQISAFGRIRQELHAIGLEYDLENLLVLFRILTPEQLREARSNIQS